jgi:hypothetical protein
MMPLIGQKEASYAMEFLIIALLSIVGAGMIAGGIFLYRQSTNTNPRAVGVAFIAAGVAMWGVILCVTPVFRMQG